MTTKREKKYPCPIPGCWQKTSTERSLCSACRSWWYRISTKTHQELAQYVQRVGRFSGRLTRISNITHNIGGRKVA